MNTDIVEIVIKIPRSELEYAKKGYTKAKADVVYRAIENGTVLPKGHGALKDADKIVMESNVDMWTDSGYESMVAVEDINNAPTIVEADKEERI